MPTNKPHLKAYVSPEEYARVADLAGRTGLSLSSFVRQVCLAQEVRSLVDKEAVLALLKSKADLGRLGCLLKKHLSETGSMDARIDDLRSLLRTIEYTQRELAREFRGVIEQYARGAKK
jgi:Trp operon repressor